jgi:hypothetical protein
MIKQIFMGLITLTFFSGCFNERGISMRYYNDCEEYYDVQGYYHKKCGDNIVDYSEIKNEIKKVIAPSNTAAPAKVW